MNFKKFVLILISFCLFFNVSIGSDWNLEQSNHTFKVSPFLKISQIKKSNILIDFDIETSVEEVLEEETDSDDGEFSYLVYSHFEISFDSIKRNQEKLFSNHENKISLKLPLFIKFRNLRL